MKHYLHTITTSICAILFFMVIYHGQLKPFPIYFIIVFIMLWSFLIYSSWRRDIRDKNRKRIFKYDIGDSTDKGIIESRYYMESKNRNGGDMSGYYYIMEDGKSYNEFLINRDEKLIQDL